jgi:DNA-binding response OmpR family regulator
LPLLGHSDIELEIAGNFPIANKESKVDIASSVHRILIVDDTEDAAVSLEKILQILGHEARVCHDGHSALELIPQFQPDLVLLDIGLPGMSGYEVARRIRGHEWGRDLRLVALTGFGQEKDKINSRQAGFDEHIVKPAELSTIRELLNSLNGRG